MARTSELVAVLIVAGCSRQAPVMPAEMEPAQIQAELTRIEALGVALDTNGIAGVVDAKLPCPTIHSKYYSERIVARQPKMRALEQARRDFGLKLARALDEMAERLARPCSCPPEDRARDAATLLDCSEWIRASRGYGNNQLLRRCESIATVPLAYLTADLDFPLDAIESQASRITSYSEDRAFRVEVLDEEAPRPLFAGMRGTEEEQAQEMRRRWATGYRAMSEWFERQSVPCDKWQRETLPEELAFFLDDNRSGGPSTTSNEWELKMHESLLGDRGGVEIRQLHAFIIFRKRVGAFPTVPPSWWRPGMWGRSAVQVAFVEAWEPFRRQYSGEPGAPDFDGASLFERVVAGDVMDSETQRVHFAAAENARREKGH